MDSAPAVVLGEFLAFVDVNEFVGEKVDVETVAFVEFEDAESTQFWPLTENEGE
jgi:hypothetical protein